MKIEFINNNKIEGTTNIYGNTLTYLLNIYAVIPLHFIDKRYKTLNPKQKTLYINIDLLTYNMNNMKVCNVNIYSTKKEYLIGSCICRASLINRLYESYNVE